MKAVLLDGSQANDSIGERIHAALAADLEGQGWDVEHIALRDKKIGNCGGEFFCWIKHPGTCMLDDDNRTIAAALVASDLAVYLTPVTFGGYSSVLKRMVDHQIQNVSPFFTEIEGETHHHKRYDASPDFLAVGWMDAPDEQSETVFRHLVQRNGINWHSETVVTDVVVAGRSDEKLQALVHEWLHDLQSGRSSDRVELPKSGYPTIASSASAEQQLGTASDSEPVAVRRGLLLVGSPKTRKSTSNSLGGYLMDQLGERSIQTETVYLHPALRSPEKTQDLLDAVEAADLVALSFPLYVDSLPAPVIEALERIAARRRGGDQSRRQLFAAITNCGFPEANHCNTALAICEAFAREAGFRWAGGLAFGGGGMVNGQPLAETGGKTIVMRKSLELVAEELAQGQAIPKTVQGVLGKQVFPAWAYRLMGGVGWYFAARGYGAIRKLKSQPYLEKVR